MNKLIYIALAGVALSQLHGCAAVAVGGAATGTAAVLDRRTTGVFVGDQEIELRAMSRLGEAIPEKTGNISVTSYNRQVLLTGQVPDETTRSRASEVVKGVPEVRTVFNELGISGVTSFTARANDSAITGNVKTRLLGEKRVPGTKVKVVTESGVVYLMGLLTPTEARVATDIARTTSGVTKVVTLFETVD
ncbi:MAG TPA: BON domain-containing protein [Thiobacillus sp.]|jgi:osmotically-inducible protein OsmY|nr:BON domain-containing protein [Thiobacillus sp.]